MSSITPDRVKAGLCANGMGAPARMRAGVVAALLLLAGCGTSGLTGSASKSAEGTTSTASGSVPFGDRVSSLFGGGSQSSAATQAAAASSVPTSDDFDCPRIDIRSGASTLLINTPGGEGDPLGLRYQGSFVRAARECRVQAPNVVVKLGVQGRVILGPAGTAGELTMPLRYALVEEKIGSSKVLWSKLYLIPVTVPPDQPAVNFTHITEDLSFPIPSAATLDNLVLYIGFDPIGAEAEAKKKAPPRASRRR
jgi:hypothetical protein